MKKTGLLIKDFFLLAKYCRSFLLIIAIFLGVSVVGSQSDYYTVFPCLLVGLMPATLLSYDEREKWDVYAQTLPVSRAQFVGEKYLMGALCLAGFLVLQLLVSFLSGAVRSGADLAALLLVDLALGLLAPAVMLPFFFRFGVEKGRILLFAMTGLMTLGLLALTRAPLGALMLRLPSPKLLTAVAVPGIVALYALSCLLSIRLYRDREL